MDSATHAIEVAHFDRLKKVYLPLIAIAPSYAPLPSNSTSTLVLKLACFDYTNFTFLLMYPSCTIFCNKYAYFRLA